METTAEKHCKLAAESIEQLGYVLDSIIRAADQDAITGRKIDVGYIYKYADGSAIEYNVLEKTIKPVGAPE